MKVTLVGTGCGSMYTMTAGAVKAIREAELIIGAERLLKSIPDEWEGQREAAISSDEILSVIKDRCDSGRDGDICVIFSGDTGFYSGARTLLPLLEKNNIDSEVIPGISSVQMMAARIGRPWQDWKLVSAHGVDCDPAACLDEERPTFFLTGGRIGPAEVCAGIVDEGMGQRKVIIAERLSYEDEKIHEGRAEEFTDADFDSLAVILVEPMPEDEAAGHDEKIHSGVRNFRPGLPDYLFIRGDVPMTKRDVRAVISGHMQIREEDVVWDIGAGTGSVTIEIAIQAIKGKVYAIERDSDGVVLIGQNAERFGVHNIDIIEGEAPDALRDLPAPDRVFIGGSGGRMREIIELILEKNPRAQICASAIMIETAAEAMAIMEEHGMETAITQVSISSGRSASEGHMMIGGNPIFIMTGTTASRNRQ